jgi:hypothetical protein
MTPGAGRCAVACLKARIPFLGLCMTDAHARLLEQHLMIHLFENMICETSKLHDTEVAKLIPAATAPKAKAKGKAKGKAGGKREKKQTGPKSKKPKTEAAEDEDEQEDEEEEDADESDKGDE